MGYAFQNMKKIGIHQSTSILFRGPGGERESGDNFSFGRSKFLTSRHLSSFKGAIKMFVFSGIKHIFQGSHTLLRYRLNLDPIKVGFGQNGINCRTVEYRWVNLGIYFLQEPVKLKKCSSSKCKKDGKKRDRDTRDRNEVVILNQRL